MKISTILDHIGSGHMALPEFQRGYVWNSDQVRKLLTSLYLRRPVGGLLVWATGSKSARTREEIDKKPHAQFAIEMTRSARRIGRVEMHAVRTPRNVLSIVLLVAACIAQLILGATAQTSALEGVTNAINEASPLKKAGSPHDHNTTGIVTGDPNGTEFAAADEIATLIATGQETGPHGEVALRVAPMDGDGGLQNIRDVLTLAGADMSIVPVAMLYRARAALSLDNVREQIVYIAPLYEEEFHILAPSAIGNISDLAGKTINLGMKNSAVAVLGKEIFDRLGLKVNVVNLDQSGATSAMRTGEIAADLLLSSKPVGSLASYDGEYFHVIAIPYLPALKDFLPATLTHDDYPNLILPGQSIDTIGARSVLIAYNWPKGSDRYRLLDFFVRTLFSRFSELQTGPHHPKWREVNLAATLPSWTRFPPAQRWLDQQEFESFLSKRGIGAEPDQPPPKTDQWETEAGIACPPRDTFENAQAWVHERLNCERHPTPNDPWIEWAEYCPRGPLGYFVLKVKTGQQKVYLFENIPPAVWEGFKAAPAAGKFYHSEIKGKRHWFRLASELKPSTCHP